MGENIGLIWDLGLLHHPPSDQFNQFDDDSNNLIGSLHLDTDEEPRRMGATSRANSVRFDESANQGHWSHASRSSMDLLSRSGGMPLNERTSSHKSDGRASSVHSVRSAASGRASSIGLDTGFGHGDSNRSPLDTPGLAPGLLILGSVPAIIRCWMNTNFKHDSLLYAAVCSGSHKSFLHRQLVDKLGFGDQISTNDDGIQNVVLPVYLPEAVPHPASSRSSSPAPQLPTITVTFTIMDIPTEEADSKCIKIILGSDTLRMHNADILLSCNNLSILDDDRNKLSIPLVRPEEEHTFDGLRTVVGPSLPSQTESKAEEVLSSKPATLNGLGQSTQSSADRLSSLAEGSPRSKWRRSGPLTGEGESGDNTASEHGGSSSSRPASRASIHRSNLPAIGSRTESKDLPSEEATSQTTTPSRGGTSPAIWSNWRREGTTPGSQTSQFDWANAGKNRDSPSGPARKDTGMKVLRPMRTSSRTFSTGGGSTTASTPAADTPSGNRSRFFDDTRRRGGGESFGQEQTQAESQSTEGGAKDGSSQAVAGAAASGSSGASSGLKSRSNPAGASAFAWLNQGGSR